MAILKHQSSKSANYTRIMEYLMFEQDRMKNRSRRNENGNLILRKNFLIDGIECEVGSFDIECMELNRKWNKNQEYDDIKSHHYIISFAPKDATEGTLTLEQAQRIGIDFTKRNFAGHQALVCTHSDGEQKSGNIHIHIIINSLRKRDVKKQDFMERNIDAKAGYKHHLTRQYLAHLKRDLMRTCEKEKLHQVDLIHPARKRVTDREYWAKVRGQQRIEKQADGKEKNSAGNPAQKTEFQLQKDVLRTAIEEISKVATSEEDFANRLQTKYKITLKVSRERYSFIHPHRERPITGRVLGADYTENHLKSLFAENRKKEKQRNKSAMRQNLASQKSEHRKTGTTSRETHNTRKVQGANDKEIRLYPKAVTMPTDNHFVRKLQETTKEQIGFASERRAKIANLQKMANAILYVQEHGYETREEFDKEYAATSAKTHTLRKKYKTVSGQIRGLNEQIHYTGQYFANRKIYQDFLKSWNKGRFRNEHANEIAKYEAARNYLMTKMKEGTLPSQGLVVMKKEIAIPNITTLKELRGKLIEKQKEYSAVLKEYEAKKTEFGEVKRSIDEILREPMQSRGRAHGIEW